MQATEQKGQIKCQNIGKKTKQRKTAQLTEKTLLLTMSIFLFLIYPPLQTLNISDVY